MYKVQELETIASQNAIPSKQQLGGSLPYAFTEHGVLTSVLKSDKAINVSIPKDFMFEFTTKEFEDLRSQIDASGWGGTVYMPMRCIL